MAGAAGSLPCIEKMVPDRAPAACPEDFNVAEDEVDILERSFEE